MKSLRELFRIGKGPSSSHTMGPAKAAQIYAGRHPEAKGFEVTLYGSLAQQDFREPLKTRGMLYARAADSILYAITSDDTHRISFDHVVQVMKRTDRDLPSLYKETSQGGLALKYEEEMSGL